MRLQLADVRLLGPGPKLPPVAGTQALRACWALVGADDDVPAPKHLGQFRRQAPTNLISC